MALKEKTNSNVDLSVLEKQVKIEAAENEKQIQEDKEVSYLLRLKETDKIQYEIFCKKNKMNFKTFANMSMDYLYRAVAAGELVITPSGIYRK